MLRLLPPIVAMRFIGIAGVLNLRDQSGRKAADVQTARRQDERAMLRATLEGEQSLDSAFSPARPAMSTGGIEVWLSVGCRLIDTN